MAKSCEIIPQVRKKGSDLLVDSELWKEIYEHTNNNRKLTLGLYRLSKNQEFRELHHLNDEENQDVNGEPSFDAFNKAIGEKLDVKSYLTSKLPKTTVNSASEAIDIVTKFNNPLENNTSDGYIATYTKAGKGKYNISIVKDTVGHRNSLTNRIRHETLLNKFNFYLKRLGLSYTFTDDEDAKFSRGIEDKVDGFYDTIKISTSDKTSEQIEESVATNCGNVAIILMQNNPLVQRLKELLTPQAIKSIQEKYGYTPVDVQKVELEDSNGNKVEEEVATREEMAGYLIGKAMYNGIDEKYWVGRIASRAWGAIKRTFINLGKIITNDRSLSKTSLMADVNNTVAKIVGEFISLDPTEKTLEPIVQLKVIPLGNISLEQKTYTALMQQLKLTATTLKSYAYDSIWGDSIEEFINKYYAKDDLIKDEDGVPYSEDVQKQLFLDRIAEAVINVLGELEYTVIPAMEKLSGIDDFDLNNTKVWYDYFRSNMNTLRGARESLTLATHILRAVSQLTNSLLKEEKYSPANNPLLKINVNPKNAIGFEGKDLISLNKQLTELIGRATTEIVGKEQKAFCQFLQLVEGGQGIPQTARVLFKDSDTKRIAEELGLVSNVSKVKTLTAVPAWYKPIEEVLQSCNDISLFSRFVTSMCDNEDIVGVLVDKQIKKQNKLADDTSYKDAFSILQLAKEGVNLGLSKDLHEIIEMEEDTDGTLIPTGNFIQERNWGKWEDLIEEHYKKWKDEFRETHKTSNMSDNIANGEELSEFLKDKVKEFHKQYSEIVEDPITGIKTYMPSSNFHNPAWDKLTKEQQDYVKKWIQLKESKEGNIRGAASYRLPQISGTAISMFPQYVRRDGLLKGAKSAILRKLRLDVITRNDPQDFGSEETYNTREEDWFSTEYRYELEKINRLPIYGVSRYSKEKRRTQLSTNIVNTMIAYCNMANVYNSMHGVIDALEVGRDVLADRTVDGIRDKHRVSRAYTRYSKYMDKQIYNLKKTELSKYNAINGTLNILNKLAAFCYLGGNIPGGIVNLGTGIVNLYKESIVGEFMSFNSLNKAVGLYLGNIPYMLAEDIAGRQDIGAGLSKMSLFLDKMNSGGDSRAALSHFETGIIGYAQQVLSPMNLAMSPYSIGEKLMQGVTYVAMALDTTIIDPETGESTNVWDAYNKVKEGTGLYKYQIEMDKSYLRADVLNVNSKWYKADKHYKRIKEFRKDLQIALDSYDILGGDKVTIDQINGKDYSDVVQYLTHSYKWKTKGDNFEEKPALALKTEAKVTKDILKETIYQVDTFLNEVEWNGDAESELMDKAREINNRMHGIYNKQDKTALANNIVGATLLIFKNYALGYIQDKFAPDHYSEVLGKYVEGSFITLSKVLYGGMAKNSTMQFSGNTTESFGDMLRFIVTPYSNFTKKKMRQLGFSENQVFNMKRNFNTAVSILILNLIKLLTACKEDLDKEYKDINKLKWETWKDYKLFQYKTRKALWKLGPTPTASDAAWGRLNYIATRLSWEQASYFKPIYMYREYKNLFDLNPVALSIGADLATLAWYTIYPETYTKDSPQHRYVAGEKKASVKARKLNPITKSIYWWEHPYDAREGWEYGTSLRAGK